MAAIAPQPSTLRSCNRARGFTLAELLIVVAIVAILAALVVPPYNDAIARARVKDATEHIHGLVLLAQTEGRIRDTNLSVAVNSDAWCVGVAPFPNCDCTLGDGAGACILPVAGQPVLQTVLGDAFPGVAVSGNLTGTTFNRLRRTASPWGTIAITAREQTLEIKIGLTGRTRVCAPSGSHFSGYPGC